jgi:hypothetical protein
MQHFQHVFIETFGVKQIRILFLTIGEKSLITPTTTSPVSLRGLINKSETMKEIVITYFSEPTMRIPTLSVRRAVLALICVSSVLATVLALPACTDYWRSAKIAHELFRPEWFSAEWREEVQLSDGRVVEIVQQRRYEKAYAGDGSGKSTIVRDAWIRFQLPETQYQEVVWHENLIPMRFDVAEGRPFIVAYPPTYREAIKYERPKPSYLGYIYKNNQWRRVDFSEIPESLYDFNLVAKQLMPEGVDRLILSEKNSKNFNGYPDISRCARRVNVAPSCTW